MHYKKRIGACLLALVMIFAMAAPKAAAKEGPIIIEDPLVDLEDPVIKPIPKIVFDMKVMDDNGIAISGLPKGAFKIVDGNGNDATKSYTVEESTTKGTYTFTEIVDPASPPTHSLRVLYTVSLNLSGTIYGGEYAVDKPGEVRIAGGKVEAMTPARLKLVSPAFTINVYDENLNRTSGNYLEVVLLKKNADGTYMKDDKGNFIPSKEPGDILWTGTASATNKIGLPRAFLKVVDGVYYAGNKPISKKEILGVVVHENSELRSDYIVKGVDFWNLTGTAFSVSGSADIVIKDLTVDIKVKVVTGRGAGETKEPLGGVTVALFKDTDNIVGKENYKPHGETKTTDKKGEVLFENLPVDEILNISRDTTTGIVSVDLPYEIELTKLPTGFSYDETVEVVIDKAKLKETAVFEIEAKGVSVTRLEGGTRFETAVLNAEEAFPAGIEAKDGFYDIFVADAYNYPDALAGAPLAGLYDGPVLLTGKDNLAVATRNYIRRVVNTSDKAKGTVRVTILGGTNAISKYVEDQIKGLGVTVDRLYGYSRVDTAVAIGAKLKSLNSSIEKATFGGKYNNKTTAILADANNYADVLSISSIAAEHKVPILLTNKLALSEASKKALEDWKIEQVIVIGGPLAVSDTVVKAVEKLDILVTRVYGADRYGTSLAIAKAFHPTATGVYVARGDQYSDALTGAVAAGKAKAPILLLRTVMVKPGDSNNALMEYLKATNVTGITIIGGEKAISKALELELQKAIE